jgi:tetratricopeptide (TPR) repeat protein
MKNEMDSENVVDAQVEVAGVGFIKNLMNRRVPQILLVYLAASWTLLQFIDWLVKRYTLSPHLTDLGLVIFLSLIPSAMVVAYFHGKTGQDRWHKLELFGIPLNVLGSIFLCVLIFSGKDLGSTLHKVSVSDEHGQTIEKKLPKNEFRKNILLFFFDNPTKTAEIDWLRHGLPFMLQLDLQQDHYMKASNIRDDAGMLNTARTAGYPEATGLPVMLMKKLALDQHQDHFLSAELKPQDKGYGLRYTVYRSADLKKTASGDLQNEDLFDLVDTLSAAVRQALGLPVGYGDKESDMPFGEIFTRSLQAARLFCKGLSEITFQNNFNGAIESLEAAISMDPQFAYAYLFLSQLYFNNNRADDWKKTQKPIMELTYKFPERQQHYNKVMYYWSQEQPEKSMAVLDMIISLYPEDIDAYLMRASFYKNQNQTQAMVMDLEKVLEIDPRRVDILKQLAQQHRRTGDIEKALACYLQYEKQFPQDADIKVELGKIKVKQGRLEEAKVYFEQALLLKPDDAATLGELGRIEMDQGRFSQAEALFLKSEANAHSDQEKIKSLAAMESYFYTRGQLTRALEYNSQKTALRRNTSSPIVAYTQEIDRIPLLAAGGRVAEAEAKLSELRRLISPPVNKIVTIGDITLNIFLKKADEAERLLPDLEFLVNSMGMGVLKVAILETQAHIAELRGDLKTALELFGQQKAQVPMDPDINLNLVRCYRLLHRHDEAQGLISARLEQVPFDARMNLEAARVCLDAGRRDEALGHLEKTLAVWQHADKEFYEANEARELLAHMQQPAK